MKRIVIIVGTRPNFIKITQFRRVAMDYPELEIKILHTGQHTQANMSKIFFEQFGIAPDFHIDLNSRTPSSQIGEIITGLESALIKYSPDLVMVVGDVNSTLAGAIVANKMGFLLAHLESGLRSGDRNMPEEINRLLTDQLTDHYFITEKSGSENLNKEGLSHNHHFVGNTMIDTLVAFEEQIQKDKILSNLNINQDGFVLMTIHRPATVDNKEGLSGLFDLITTTSQYLPVVFPIHPRTVDKLKKFNLYDDLVKMDNFFPIDPLGYFSFQKLVSSCKLIITDSGGIQEESTFRQIPCFTLRDNTERPVTIEKGTNQLIKADSVILKEKIKEVLEGKTKNGVIPNLWDGKATERVLSIVNNILS